MLLDSSVPKLSLKHFTLCGFIFLVWSSSLAWALKLDLYQEFVAFCLGENAKNPIAWGKMQKNPIKLIKLKPYTHRKTFWDGFKEGNGIGNTPSASRICSAWKWLHKLFAGGDTCADRKVQRDFFCILAGKSGWRSGKGWNLIRDGDLERSGIWFRMLIWKVLECNSGILWGDLVYPCSLLKIPGRQMPLPHYSSAGSAFDSNLKMKKTFWDRSRSWFKTNQWSDESKGQSPRLGFEIKFGTCGF